MRLGCSLCDYWTEGRAARANLVRHLVMSHSVLVPPDARRVATPKVVETEYERGYQAGYRAGRRRAKVRR